MKWYTIVAVEPKPELPVITNCAGQSIVFDGPGRMSAMLAMARESSLHAEECQLFTGKNLGKQIYTFRHGNLECTYCGKAHL